MSFPRAGLPGGSCDESLIFSCTVADRLLNKAAVKPVRILGRPTTLQRYSSSHSQAADSKNSEAIPGCCVVVSGITKDIDVEEEIVPLLENTRKGGGPVEKIERLSLTEDSVLITFVDQSGMIYNFFTALVKPPSLGLRT